MAKIMWKNMKRKRERIIEEKYQREEVYRDKDVTERT